MNGLNAGDLVSIVGVDNTPGGISNDAFNSLHEVITSDFHTFTINVGVSATTSEKTGGSDVLCSFNRPYEVIDVVTGAMTLVHQNCSQATALPRPKKLPDMVVTTSIPSKIVSTTSTSHKVSTTKGSRVLLTT